MGWTCGLCGMKKVDCENNSFCRRTILNRREFITIKNDEGDETMYYPFNEAAQAMKEYVEMTLLKENTFNKVVLTEKIKTDEESERIL